MAGKESKDKGKEVSSQYRQLSPSMSQKPSHIVPYPGYSPIQITNRFTSLGSTTQSIRPNYQSALISSYDPYQVPVTQFSQSSPSYQKTSPYQFRSQQNLFIIEPQVSNLSNPALIAKSYFPPNYHFLPLHPQKSLQFYKDILFETQSVEIKPIKDKNDPKLILFHSLYIRQILSQHDWGEHPYTLHILKSTLQYSYYDYIEAWYKIFLHQHIDFSHSWFINFDSKFHRKIPYWFRSWWETHGPNLDLLPLELSQTFSHFSSKYKPTPEEKFFTTFLIFMAKYKIPWILKWSYEVNPDLRVLYRKFVVKWWDKFNVSRIMGQVYEEFPHNQKLQKPTMSEASQSSLQIEGKSSSELKALAKEILAHAAHLDDYEDATPKSPSSQGSSSNQAKASQKKKEPKIAWADYPADSQDPYDAYDLDKDEE